MKTLKIGSDLFFNYGKTPQLTPKGWENVIKNIGRRFVTNGKIKQEFKLTLTKGVKGNEILFTLRNEVKILTPEQFKSQDLDFLRNGLKSDIGLRVIVDGWKFWFKHIYQHFLNSGSGKEDYGLIFELCHGAVHLKEVNIIT